MAPRNRQGGFEQGLYDPNDERDACGFGMIAQLDDQPSRALVDTAIAALKDAGWSGDKDDEGDIAFDYQGNDETVVTIDPKGGYHLRVYAVDLGRGPDGNWWVLSDRTQAPSGMGYVLENRIALSRSLPDYSEGFTIEGISAPVEIVRNNDNVPHIFGAGDVTGKLEIVSRLARNNWIALVYKKHPGIVN